MRGMRAWAWRMQVEGRKRHEFLNAVVSVMDGHLRYFKQGLEALCQLEPYIHQVLSRPPLHPPPPPRVSHGA